MRRLGLMLGLLFIVSACSNATFKGVTGGKARNDSAPPANNEDATGSNPTPEQNPPLPIPTTPGSENPNTQNPGTVPCDPMAISLSSLYQLNADPCHNHDTDDSGSGPDDDTDDDMDDDTDEPGQNNPGQNNY